MRAIRNISSEETMRADLAGAVAGVLAGMDPNPAPVDDAELEALLAAADLVTQSRTGVTFDYKGDVADAHAPEMPTRFAKQLAQVLRGGVAIGMSRTEAMRLAIRCARDSIHPVRLAIVDDLAANPRSTSTEVRQRLNKPRSTVDRQLQALHMLEVAEVEELKEEGYSRWRYSLAEGIDPQALEPRTRNVSTPAHTDKGGAQGGVNISGAVVLQGGPDISGTSGSGQTSAPVAQVEPDEPVTWRGVGTKAQGDVNKSGTSGDGRQQYGTCAGCGEFMRIVEPGQRVHPGCEAS
jgi:hypothetical protein